MAKATTEDVDACDVLLLGRPTMGAEVLKEGEFEPDIASIEGRVSGKKIELFGPLGGGEDEWMRRWTERIQTAGAVLVTESLIVNEAPAGEAE